MRRSKSSRCRLSDEFRSR